MTRDELAEKIAYYTSVGHWSADGLAAFVMGYLSPKWQPIETAPRDGSHVLAWYERGGQEFVCVAWYERDEHDLWGDQGFDSKDDLIGWWTYVSSVSQEQIEPTYWAVYEAPK